MWHDEPVLMGEEAQHSGGGGGGESRHVILGEDGLKLDCSPEASTSQTSLEEGRGNTYACLAD